MSSQSNSGLEASKYEGASMEGVIIRAFKIEDYHAAYALRLKTCKGLNNLSESRDGVAAFLDRNPGTCFVAEADGKLIGTIMGGFDGRFGSLNHLGVVKEYRMRGIGKTARGNRRERVKKQGNRVYRAICLQPEHRRYGFL